MVLLDNTRDSYQSSQNPSETADSGSNGLPKTL